ncbi:ribonuclease H-like domain-containing protein [Tanacetum coccineum]
MVGTVEQEYEPTSVEEKQERRNEMKARATLMMALQTKDQLKFPHIKMQSANGAIKKRNGSSMGDGHVQSSQEDYSKESGRSEHNGLKSGFDKLKVECFNCHKHGHFARECSGDSYSECLDSSRWNGGYDWSSKLRRTKLTKSCFEAFTSLGALLIQNCLESVEARLVHYKKNETWVLEDSINVLKLKVRLRDNALDVYKLNLEKAKAERDQLKQTLEKFQNSSKSLNEILECQVIDKFKKGLGYNAATAASPAVEGFVNLTDKSGSDKAYHAVPPPLTGNFIPRKPDLTFIDEIVESENLDVTTVVTPSNVKTNSDDESEIDYTIVPSIEKTKSVKTVRETDAAKQNPRGNQRNWNNLMSQRLGNDFKMTNKACYTCGSFEHLHYVCDKKVARPAWKPLQEGTASAAVNTVRPVNTANTKAVNTARPVNTAASKQTVNHPRPINNTFKRGYSQSSRPFNRYFANKNSITKTNVNTVSVKHTTARDRAVVRNKGKGANAVKASACWVWKAKNSSASTTFKKFSYIDARGRSKSIMAWIPKKI